MSNIFAKVRKAHNFKFSEKELADLDALVEHFQSFPDYYFSFGRVTRTDVLRKLIRGELQRIEDNARKKIEADAEADAKRIFKKRGVRKAVKK